MNWKRIARSLVCLLVICALVLNVSPVRGSATSATGTYVAYKSLETVIEAILIGLGVTVGTGVVLESGDDFMDSLINFVTLNYPGVTDDVRVKVYDTSFTANPDFPFLIDSTLVDMVRDWLFDNDILYVSQAQTLGSGFTVYGAFHDFWKSVPLYDIFSSAESGFLLTCGGFGGIIVDSSSFSVPVLRVAAIGSIAPFTSTTYPLGSLVDGYTPSKMSNGYFCRNYDDAYALWLENSSIVYYLIDDSCFVTIGGGLYGSKERFKHTLYLGCLDSSGMVTTSSVTFSLTNASTHSTSVLAPNYSTSDVVESDLDLSLAYVALPGVSLADGYAAWFSNSITVPGEIAGTDSDVLALPIIWGGTLAQEDVWYGTIDSAVDGSVAGEGSIARTPWKTFVDALTDFIVTPILNGIKAIFVPSEDFLTEKVNIILDEFSFGEAIVRLAQTLIFSFADYGRDPPVVYINLGDARTDYALGGKVAFIDMHWYEEYKPTVDTLLSSFFWLYFIWKMFKQLPGIISGMPGDFVMNTISAVGLGDHLPGRDLGHVITRAENQADMRTAWKWYQEDDSFADLINIRRGLKK